MSYGSQCQRRKYENLVKYEDRTKETCNVYILLCHYGNWDDMHVVFYEKTLNPYAFQFEVRSTSSTRMLTNIKERRLASMKRRRNCDIRLL